MHTGNVWFWKKRTTYFHQPSVPLETVAGWIKVYLPVSTLSPLPSIAQQPGLHIVIAQQIIVKSMMLIHELVYWEIIAAPVWLFGWNVSIKPGFSLRSEVFTQSAASFYFSHCSYKWKSIIHFKDSSSLPIKVYYLPEHFLLIFFSSTSHFLAWDMYKANSSVENRYILEIYKRKKRMIGIIIWKEE